MTDMLVTITGTDKYRLLMSRFDLKITLPCTTCTTRKCNESMTRACLLKQLFPAELYNMVMSVADNTT